jgi:hypothetical protein
LPEGLCQTPVRLVTVVAVAVGALGLGEDALDPHPTTDINDRARTCIPSVRRLFTGHLLAADTLTAQRCARHDGNAMKL